MTAAKMVIISEIVFAIFWLLVLLPWKEVTRKELVEWAWCYVAGALGIGFFMYWIAEYLQWP